MGCVFVLCVYVCCVCMCGMCVCELEYAPRRLSRSQANVYALLHMRDLSETYMVHSPLVTCGIPRIPNLSFISLLFPNLFGKHMLFSDNSHLFDNRLNTSHLILVCWLLFSKGPARTLPWVWNSTSVPTLLFLNYLGFYYLTVGIIWIWDNAMLCVRLKWVFYLFF